MVTLAAPGCGHSVEGDYLRLCKESCVAGDECEDQTKIVVDREECEQDCDNNSDNFADDVEDECNGDYEIDGEQVDRCSNALNDLTNACRDDDDDAVQDAFSDYTDECLSETYVRCR